jgi:heterodisulfide reductase subunit B
MYYLYYPGCTLDTKAKNLNQKQAETKQKYLDFKEIPVLYFTQLLGIAMGLDYRTVGFEQNAVDPLPLLKEKGLL